MEKAAYDYLKITLGKREALNLYYRLTAYIREQDATSFSSFMAFRCGTMEDYALMAFVLHIMLTRHQEMLTQLMPTAEKEASV